jgi:hypothetical protein
MKLKSLIPTLVAGAFVTMSTVASAATVLTLQQEAQQAVGPQSTSAPCIIAATQCQNPAGFGFTNFVASGNDSSYDETSPTYTVSQFTNLFGTAEFNVAIDVNTTSAAGETLESFEVFVNGVLQFFYTGPTLIGNVSNNGNGYADWTLRTVDLTSFAANALVTFKAVWSGASDGGESFFLVDANGRPPAEVPIPAAAWLLGSGLLAMGAIGRRRIKGMV